jgi:hypothetical protein
MGSCLCEMHNHHFHAVRRDIHANHHNLQFRHGPAAVPPNPEAWTPPPGRVFATFDVPADSVQPLSPNGWVKIYGSNSMFADYCEITEMPEPLNIVVLF